MFSAPFFSLFSMSLACAIVILALAAWRQHWPRGTMVFLLLSLSVAAWLMGIQTILEEGWRVTGGVWMVVCAFAPAIAFHFTTILARRRSRGHVVLMYLLGASLTLLAQLSIQSTSWVVGASGILSAWLVAIVIGVSFLLNFVAFIFAIVTLYPTLHDTTRPLLERRRETYGVLLVVFFLATSVMFLIGSWFSGIAEYVMFGLAGVWFVGTATAFVRCQFLDVAFEPLQPLLILTGSILLVGLFNQHDSFGFLGMAIGSVLLLAVGTRKSLRADGERQTLDQAKSEFVALVAHQLRSPLGGIRSASDMLANGDYGPLPDAAKKTLKFMRQTAERLLSLGETSLAAARFDVGAFQTTAVPVDVRHEIQLLIEEAQFFASAKGLDVTISWENVPERVVIDPEILRNVVFNLLDNAIKYTDTGRITIHVSVADRRLRIEIRDTGIGLTPEDQKQLFHRFCRGKASHDIRHQGVGLGLYVTKKMVEAVNGTISVESPGLGKGTTFHVEFPLMH